MFEKRDLRIFTIIIFVIIFVIATFYLYPTLIGFAAFTLYYWYISGPISLALLMFYYYFKTHRANYHKAMIIDSLNYREAYQLETGLNPITNNSLSKMYRKWMLKKNHPGFSRKLKQFYQKIEVLAGILILFIIFSLAFVALYRYLFWIDIFNLGG